MIEYAGVLGVTRRSLHAVGETLLAGTEWRLSGSIRLYASPGGFRTGPLGSAEAFLAVRGTDLVVRDAGEERVIALGGTLAELAREAGVEFGAPVGVYGTGSGADASDRVRVDPTAAAEIEHSFALGDEACRRLAAVHVPGEAIVPVLWPEHFDIGISLDAVNYGVSAGDDAIPQPYAYVGPHQPRQGPFWDQPFGATRLVRDLADVADLVAFFEQGRRRTDLDPIA